MIDGSILSRLLVFTQEHCDGIAGGWGGFKIDGDTMGSVGRAWWNSDGTDTAAKHTRLPCRYNTDSFPRACNPTCPNPPML